MDENTIFFTAGITILGGFLAAGSGWFVPARIEKARIDRTEALLIVALKDDLTNSIEIYKKLTDEWDKGNIVWFTTINEVLDSRDTYLKNRELITLISDETLRQRILLYYWQSANHLLKLQNAQQRKYDIERIYNTLVRDLRIHQGLEVDVAISETQKLMVQEDKELFALNSKLPNLVQGLEAFKTEAVAILEKIS